ncbi:MAG: GTP-binding protein, partial [Candidatus Omnitrophica bacterium]|nr:GTP-binding protein [Candidatus Omnitrophota bacterium]
DDLMKIYAHMEACLDFPDEHLEIYANQEFHCRYESAGNTIKLLIDSFSQGEILREGVLAVIVGKPNVGKSSILNVLLERDRAIVSEIPGTTRDAIEESIELDGIPIRLVDTAGLFTSEEPLTQASMEKTRAYMKEGDLFLLVLDASTTMSLEDQNILSELSGKRTILLLNKTDLLSNLNSISELNIQNQFKSVVWVSKPCLISAKTKVGIENLEQTIVKTIWKGNIEKESAMITRLRHKRALEVSLEALEKSYQTFLACESLEFVTLDLKRALDALREIIGEIYSEDLLDTIFKEFCIGK